MKPLAVALAALAIVFVALKIPRHRKEPVLPAFPASPVKIEIAAPAGAVTLEKGPTWRLTKPLDWPADPESVRILTGSLSSLSADTVMTSRAETHGQYEVSEASGIRVTVFGEGAKEPVSLIFGKTAPDYSRTYVRVPDKPEVFLARGLRRSDVEKTTTQWRDRRVLLLNDAERPARIEFRRGGVSIELRRSSETWQAAGKTVDSQAVENFVAALRRLTAEEFVDENADLQGSGLLKPKESLTAELDSNRTIRFSVGRKDAKTGRWPVLREGESSVLLVPEYEWTGVLEMWKALL